MQILEGLLLSWITFMSWTQTSAFIEWLKVLGSGLLCLLIIQSSWTISSNYSEAICVLLVASVYSKTGDPVMSGGPDLERYITGKLQGTIIMFFKKSAP